MALTRRSVQRMSGSIWPGFVDAMTALLLVLMFVLTIFMIVQFILRETISGQEDELNALALEITTLAEALGLEQQRASNLEDEQIRLTATLAEAQETADQQSALIAALQGQVSQQEAELAQSAARISSFEAQVASLLAERDDARGQVTALEAEQERLLSEQEALQLAIARARDEIDVQTEAARLAAARREALEALTAELQSEVEARDNSLSAMLARLEAAEASSGDLTARLEQSQASAADLLARLDAAEAENEVLDAELAEATTALSSTEENRLANLSAAMELRQRLADLEASLTEEEEARLAEAAAAAALRERLRNADAELTAMTLALEEQRRKAEETLTLLAAAQAAEEDLNDRLAAALAENADLDAFRAEVETLREVTGSEEELRARLAEALAAQRTAEAEATASMTEAEQRAVLLATANARLAEEEALSAESQRRVALLSEQVASLRQQLGALQAMLDLAEEKDVQAQVRIQSLGTQLNTALARVASEERRRAELEEAERIRLEEEARRLAAEAEQLERYRSEFFGQLREVLGDVEGVQIVGDRFLFSSEVLFESGSADLAEGGRTQIARVAEIMADVAGRIPSGIDWILRVDGHTDNVPVGGSAFEDNWDLSQARALSVVRFLTDDLGFPPERLAATGFGEYRPVDPADTPEARARNRRIELKLTER